MCTYIDKIFTQRLSDQRFFRKKKTKIKTIIKTKYLKVIIILLAFILEYNWNITKHVMLATVPVTDR